MRSAYTQLYKKALLFCGAIFLYSYTPAQISYLPYMEQAPKTFPIRMAHCAQVRQAPVVDGNLNEEVWNQAEPYTDFAITDYAGFGKPATRQTEFRMLYTDHYLYIGFVCMEPDTSLIRAANTRFDNPDILYDDHVEVLLDPAHDHKNIFRLVVNSRGITYDTRLEKPVQYSISYIKGSDNWNTEWRAKVKKQKDRWTGEIAIAVDRMYDGTIQTGTTWGFNFIRDSQSEFSEGPRNQQLKPGREISAFLPVRSHVLGKISDRYIEPIEFGDLVFNQQVLRVEQIQFHEAYANYNGSIWNKPQFFGDNPVVVAVRNISGKPLKIRCTVNTTDAKGKILETATEETVPPHQVKNIAASIRIRGDERQVFRLSLYHQNTLLYQTSYDTRVPPMAEFDLSALYNPEQGKGISLAPVVQPGTLNGKHFLLELTGSKGNILESDSLSNLSEYVFYPCFPQLQAGQLTPGNYSIRVRLLESSGAMVGEFSHPFTIADSRRKAVLAATDSTYSFGGQAGKAVLVHFPAGEKFVFWEHASYVPWWDLESMAVTYEFMECWNYGNQGCSEPMQDKENRYSRPHIVENSPARVVIQWRYALGDPNYQVLFNEWVHEYYYLYPDGSGVREVRFWANSSIPHEVMQPQYIFPAGVVPKQMFQDTACAVLNTRGESYYNLIEKPITQFPPDIKAWPEEIMRIYLKGRKHPYLVWSQQQDGFGDAINNGLVVGDVQRSMGGHWPMQPMNVDVYSVVGTNKPYHSWLGSVHVKPNPDQSPNRWVHLIGVTDQSNQHLIEVAANWLKPPLPAVKNATLTRYDPAQKAYVFDRISRSGCSFTFTESDVINPVFIFKGRDADTGILKINQKAVPADLIKKAVIEYEGQKALLVWVGWKITKGDTAGIAFTK